MKNVIFFFFLLAMLERRSTARLPPDECVGLLEFDELIRAV